MNHILVIDDEPDIRATLEAILAEEGYAVTTAGTAAEALDLIHGAGDGGGDFASCVRNLYSAV